MLKRFNTRFGIVVLSDPYWHVDHPVRVVTLTLTPPDLSGWGVSCEIPASKEITTEFIDEWAGHAIRLIKD